MTEWESLFLIYITWMGLMLTIVFLFGKIEEFRLAIADLQDDQREVARDLMVLKTEVDAMAAREAGRLKKVGKVL